MKKISYFLITLTIVSCNPKFYSPNSHNVPLISEKGETVLNLAGNTNQVEFQGAYAFANNFSFMGNGGLFIPADLDNGNGGSGKFAELGIGYFKPVASKFVFETYGLFGFGSMENHLPSTVATNPKTKGDVSANIMRLGIQPNFGYKSKYFTAAVSSRFVNLSYSKISGDLIYDNLSQVSYINDNKSGFLIEPAFTLRGGLEKVKLQMQFGYSFNLSNPDFKQDKSYVSVGLSFNFK